ncbi:MAG: hypothetical protein P4K94_10370 [Terracidiphilus sp.]|nr:hypothetical protein [Terracidiphilus sp.]
MSTGWLKGWVWGAITVGALSVHGQAVRVTSAGGANSAPQVLPALSASVPQPGPVYGGPVREIDDPHTGDRWLLQRDSSRPGGPGRLVLLGSRGYDAKHDWPGGSETASAQVLLAPVIHAGERLIVEEDTAVVSSRLEAVALGPAAIGATLEVRLKIGGKLLQAVALAPGRAALQMEARP